MACISTNVQLANLIKKENLENKTFLELGYLKNETVLDMKDTLTKNGAKYYRTNKEQVDGLDFLWDLHESFPEHFLEQKFDFVLCSSVMEHIAKPWVAARNIENILKPNGKLFWTTPWVHRIHGYPDDYWRFTPNGVKQLFSAIQWSWEGYEVIFNGLNSSVLFDWTEGLKDPAIEVGGEGLRSISKSQLARHFVGLKKGIVRVMSEKGVTTHNLSDYDVTKIDETLYSYMVFQSKTLISLPMGMVFMIGKKSE